jgi:hypothetical protein
MSAAASLVLVKENSESKKFKIGKIVHHITLMIEILFMVPRH